MAKKPVAPAAGGEQPAVEHVAKSKGPAFVFIGDAKGHGPDAIEAFGHTFQKNGKPVEASAAVAKKLAGNGHFKAA